MATLRVVSWNIRAAIGPGPFPDRWWRRIDADRLRAIGAFLSSLEADVVALQEVALLSRGGEHKRSILIAEILQNQAGTRVPLIFQPRDFHQLLYPAAYWDTLAAQSRLRGIPPELLAAIVREESRFDHPALSPAAARGLGRG